MSAPKRITAPKRTTTITDDNGNQWEVLHPDRFITYISMENALEQYDKHVKDGFYGCSPAAIKEMHIAAYYSGRF